MDSCIRDSSLYISIGGDSSFIDNNTRKEIEDTFEGIFEQSFVKVSDVEMSDEIEMIYEVKTPIIRNENLIKEFYNKLETLLEELSDFSPHFTQYERGDN